MADLINYPDVLGAITDVRVNFGVLQTAIASRPRTAPAGQVFEIVALLQNASDLEAEVIVTLRLPEQDAKRQKGRFRAQSSRLLVALKAAEVGVVTLPVLSAPDTAPGEYKFTLDYEVKPADKPKRIRQPEGGGAFDARYLNDQQRAALESLKPLSFSAHKLMARNTLEASFAIGPAGVAKPPTDRKAGYFSIFRLGEYSDPRPMLNHYADMLTTTTLPHLKRGETYPALLAQTQTRWLEAGFPLENTELVLIAKLLTIILEYAIPNETAHGYIAAGGYGVKNLLERNPLGMPHPPKLPRWFTAFMKMVDLDNRVAAHPVAAVSTRLYETLVYDAIMHAFDLVETATGEDLGTKEEMDSYARGLIASLTEKTGGEMSRMYLPLIMGGLLISDQMPISKETPHELLASMTKIVDARRETALDDEQPIYEIVSVIIDRTGMKYGIRT